jgi:hypothetical protein
VTLAYDTYTTVRYRIGAVAANHACVVDVDHKSGFGGCSSWDYVRLSTAGTAVAYRVDWDDRGPSTFVPGGDALIGSIGCTVATNTEGELGTLRSFELFALFADRSEQSLGRSSIMFGEVRIRLPRELLGEEGGYVSRYRQPWWVNFVFDSLGLLCLALALRSLHRTLRRARECTFPFARVV